MYQFRISKTTNLIVSLTLFRLGFLRMARLGGGGGGESAYNSKTINDNEMKFGGVVKDD